MVSQGDLIDTIHMEEDDPAIELTCSNKWTFYAIALKQEGNRFELVDDAGNIRSVKFYDFQEVTPNFDD